MILTHLPNAFAGEPVDSSGCDVMTASEELINDLLEQAPCVLKSGEGNYIVYPCVAGCAVEVSRLKHYI